MAKKAVIAEPQHEQVTEETITAAIRGFEHDYPTTVQIKTALKINGMSPDEAVDEVYRVCGELERAGKLTKTGSPVDQVGSSRWSLRAPATPAVEE